MKNRAPSIVKEVEARSWIFRCIPGKVSCTWSTGSPVRCEAPAKVLPLPGPGPSGAEQSGVWTGQRPAAGLMPAPSHSSVSHHVCALKAEGSPLGGNGARPRAHGGAKKLGGGDNGLLCFLPSIQHHYGLHCAPSPPKIHMLES